MKELEGVSLNIVNTLSVCLEDLLPGHGAELHAGEPGRHPAARRHPFLHRPVRHGRQGQLPRAAAQHRHCRAGARQLG